MSPIPRRAALTAVGGSAIAALAGCLGDAPAQSLVELDEWPPSRHADELEFWTWQRYWGDQALTFRFVADLTDITRVVVPAYEQSARLVSGNPPDLVHTLYRQFSDAMEQDLYQPLPVDAMPHWPPDTTLRTQNLSQYAHDGQYYGYPQTPVAMGLAYHFDTVEAADSWSVLWDEEYAGRIAMPADPVLLGQIGALYTGQDPFDPDDLSEIREALLAQEPLVSGYWTHWLRTWNEFYLGNLDVGVLPHPQMCLCSQDYSPVRYGVPEQIIYSQAVFAIPAQSRNPYLAAEFLNWAAQFKTGTELGWNADEWNIIGDRPVSEHASHTYHTIASELGL